MKNNSLHFLELNKWIVVWFKCQSFCSWRIANKLCWRPDIKCNNLKNVNSDLQKDYNLLRMNLWAKKVSESIDRTNEDLSDIY